MGCLRSCSAAVQGAFYTTFFKWGSLVGRKPCTVIGFAVLVALLLSANLFVQRFDLPTEVEQEKLWVPQDATAIVEKTDYESIFSRRYRSNTVIFTTQPDGGNVLTKEVLAEVSRFDGVVQHQLSAHWEAEVGNLKAGTVSYADLCGRTAANAGDNSTATCVGAVAGSALELWTRADGSREFDFTDAELAAIATSGRGIDTDLFPADGRTVNVESFLGGVTRSESGAITGAKAIRLTWLLQDQPRASNAGAANRAFEDQLNLLCGSRWTDSGLSKGNVSDGLLAWESSLVEVYPSTEGATSRELSKTIRGDISAINIAYFIIFIYATIIFSRNHPTSSRALLAASGIVSVGLSVMVAYGFSTLFVPLNPVVNVLPFILIGIGVDDMFILLFALNGQPADMPVEKRMGHAMGSAGVSITITSLTDLMAFALGATSRLPALAGFCTFAAIGILADYALQISFFAGWMALDLYRERKHKVDCCPCFFAPAPEAKSSCVPCCCCPCTYGTCTSSSQFGLQPFLKRVYIPCLRSPIVKAAVLVFFVLLTAFSGYAATNLRQDFQRRWFISDDAALQESFEMQDKYYGDVGVPVYTVTPSTAELDYKLLTNQLGLDRVVLGISSNEWMEPETLSSWWPVFRTWVHSCSETLVVDGATCVKRECVSGGALVFPYCSLAKIVRDGSGTPLAVTPANDNKFMVDVNGQPAAPGAPLADTFVPEAHFWDWLDQFAEDEALGRALASELVWVHGATPRTPSQNGVGVRATRMRSMFKHARSAKDRVATMTTMRESLKKADFGSTYSYSWRYVFYEQFAILITETFTNLALALAAVVVITLLMIVDVGATILVALCIVLTDLDILGMMWYWGLSIDSVAVINLVLAIGLALDYSVHIAHAFCQKAGSSRQERIDAALEEMGTAVIHGCISTFLAVVVLSVSKSYVFRIFFKMFFGIVVFGGAHGLVLLPVVLSLIGPDHKGRPSNGDMTTSGTDMKMAEKGAGSGLPMVHKTPPSPPEVDTAPPSPPSLPSDRNPFMRPQAGHLPRALCSSAAVAPDSNEPARCEA